VIGADNAIQWRLPEDMAHFKPAILGQPVVLHLLRSMPERPEGPVRVARRRSRPA
jgi:dihydrofolate reductase